MKRQLASLLVLALCAASPIKAASSTFYDVPSTHWAYEDIQQAAQKGILQGTGTDKNGNRLFEPQSSLTTAQFITIVVRGYYAGQAGSAVGLMGMLALLCSITGFVLAVRGFQEEDVYYISSQAGAVLDGILFIGWAVIGIIGM